MSATEQVNWGREYIIGWATGIPLTGISHPADGTFSPSISSENCRGEDALETFYLLVCRECGNGDLVMPFGSAKERGKWAADHTRATGHDRWFVKDEPQSKE